MDCDCMLAWDRYLKEHIQIDIFFISLENESHGFQLVRNKN